MARMKAMEVQHDTADGGDGASGCGAHETLGPLPPSRNFAISLSSSPGGEGRPLSGSSFRKASFRVRGPGRRGRRDSRASCRSRESTGNTVAALTSKFNALNTDTRLHGEPVPVRPGVTKTHHHGSKGRYSVQVVNPATSKTTTVTAVKAHPALVARLSGAGATGTAVTTSLAGVKATIQIFEQQQHQPNRTSLQSRSSTHPLVAQLKPGTSPLLLRASKTTRGIAVKKSDLKKEAASSTVTDQKKKPIPPKPELKPSAIVFPLIKSHPLVQNAKSKPISTIIKPVSISVSATKPTNVAAKPAVKISSKPTTNKPIVPVKNTDRIKEFLEASENLKPDNTKRPTAELKPNKSALFLPLIKSTPAVPSIAKQELPPKPEPKSILRPSHIVTSNNMSNLTNDLDIDDEATPTQESSLMTEVLKALAHNALVSPILNNGPSSLVVSKEPPSSEPPPLPTSLPPTMARQEHRVEQEQEGDMTPTPTATPKPMMPNQSFLWGNAVAAAKRGTDMTQRQQPQLPEDYDDVYISVRNSYASLRTPEGCTLDSGDSENEGAYEYCGDPSAPPRGGVIDSLGYEDCGVGDGSTLGVYDDVKSLAAASNCYESIGSCAPSYCEKNNSLYGLPEPGQASSTCSGGSLGSSSPRVASRASTLSEDIEEEPEEGPHEVLSYQLLGDLGPSFVAETGPGVGPGERRSETGSDEWVDIELSESEEQLGPPVDLSEHILIVQRERSRPKRSPSWSHMVRQQRARIGPGGRRAVLRLQVYVSSPSVVYLLPLHDVPLPPPRPPRGPRKPSPEERANPLVVLRLRLLQVGEVRESQEASIFFRDPREESSSSDSDHHYETLYETVGGTPGDIATLKPSMDHPPPPPLDEDEAFDSDVTDSSFDSDTSEEPPVLRHAIQLPPGGLKQELPELPPPPPGTKKMAKIAEAAGRKMRNLKNNLTLRKRDFSDKLRRLSVAGGVNLYSAQLSTAPQPPTTPNPAASSPTVESPPLPPASAPPLLEKSVSTGNLNNRKSWSFKGKFARQSSANSMKRESSGSIFYVSQSGEQPDTPPGLGERDTPQRRSTTESVCSSGRGSSAGSEMENGNANRRLSRGPVSRPKTPPPPPPTESALRNAKNAKNGGGGGRPVSSAWYADIEISSLQPLGHNGSSESVSKNGTSLEGDLSWYSSIGLDSSTGEPDSSHTGTASSEAGSSSSPDGSVVHGCFADEPLYQFYAASVLAEAKRELNEESDSDGYEEIGEGGIRGGGVSLTSRPSAMELIRPREGHRTLWCEVPDVINSRILDSLDQQQRKLQEAKFEIITSEASYAKSLAILVNHFVQCHDFNDESILSKTDRHILFSNILPVKACSDRFLADLERCWQEDIMLQDICEVVYRHATRNFRVYVKYCSHQIYLDRTLKKLKDNTTTAFSDALARLESSPECQSLSLHSFLMLPMQRVTRLPLLLDAVIRRLSARDSEYDACKTALFAVNKLVQECNEGARCMERMEEMLLLSRQLEFPKDVRAVPLIKSTRWLVRSGELTQITCKDEAKLTFGRRFGKLPVCVFLFTDLLVVAKRKGDESFSVIDYCARNMVQVMNPDESGVPQLPVKLGPSDVGGKNLLLLTLLQNHENKTVEMVLSCNLESDRQRWLTAFAPPQSSDNPEERVYEEWDCPQVQAIHAYAARQPDELSLEVADVVNVLRKLPDGWYQGERIRDGERGWFPGNYCREVVSSHVRARNLRQRYRLLALSREYIEQQMQERKTRRKSSSTNGGLLTPIQASPNKSQQPLPPTPLTTVS